MRYVWSLGLTLLLEGIVAWCWGLRGRDRVLFVLVNILTNPPAVLLHTLFPGWGRLLTLEAGVAIVEAVCYDRLGEGIDHPWRFSLTANVVSFGSGVLLNLMRRMIR